MKLRLSAPRQMSWRTHAERPSCCSNPPMPSIPCHKDKQAISNQPNHLSELMPHKRTSQGGRVTLTHQHRRTHHRPTHRLPPHLTEGGATSSTIPSLLFQCQLQ